MLTVADATPERLADRLYDRLHVPASAQLTTYLRGRHALRHVYRKLRPAGERVEDFGKLLVRVSEEA